MTDATVTNQDGFANQPIRVEVPVTEEGYQTYLNLDRECAECDGTGKTVIPFDNPCEDCEGIGRIPTDAGLAVLQLIVRYGHLHGIEVTE